MLKSEKICQCCLEDSLLSIFRKNGYAVESIENFYNGCKVVLSKRGKKKEVFCCADENYDYSKECKFYLERTILIGNGK